MGILNLTPDSFSDGGRYTLLESAVEHAERLVAEGADILDIGGESTRPGAEPVELSEELRRVIPALQAIAKRVSVPISIDTMKPEVALAAIAAGASIINDVTGMANPEMCLVAATTRAAVVVMHMQGTPQTMQQNPQYQNDVVTEIASYFQQQLQTLDQAGVPAERVVLDPGIGFGKTMPHNLRLLAELRQFQSLGRPVLLGVSRKGVIGTIIQRERHERLAGSLATASFALAQNAAQILRVHDVAATRDAVLLRAAIAEHETPP
ncbi:MAG: dihydropteroate synthase [Gemmataceae bacterium]